MATCDCNCTCPCTGVSTKKCKCDCTQKYGPEDLKMTLRVGTYTDYFPFQYIDTEKREFKGFEIELIKKVAEGLDYKVEFVNLNELQYEALINAIELKYIDVISAGMAATDARRQNIDFTTITVKPQIILLTHSDTTITQLEDLSEQRIGAIEGTTQDHLLEGLKKGGINLEKVLSLSVEDLVDQVIAGTIFGLAITNTAITQYLEDPNTPLKVWPELFDEDTEIKYSVTVIEKMGIGVRKGSSLLSRINELLNQLGLTGDYTVVRGSWYHELLVDYGLELAVE